MAASEPPGALVEAPLDELRPADLDDALALTAEAGWNQLAADWELMTRAGRAWAIRRDGRAVATALALPYPPGFGWISMVLVHGPERRRGHATRLVERAVEHLEALGLVPLLDATPAGAEVYGRMGFRPVDAITRWRGPGGAATGATQAAPITLEPVRALDRAAFGADRGAILDDLVARPGAVGHVAPDAVAQVAAFLNVSVAEVHGVLTFYHELRTAPPAEASASIIFCSRSM